MRKDLHRNRQENFRMKWILEFPQPCRQRIPFQNLQNQVPFLGVEEKSHLSKIELFPNLPILQHAEFLILLELGNLAIEFSFTVADQYHYQLEHQENFPLH